MKTLPIKWYIKVDEDNKDTLTNWVIKQPYFNNNFKDIMRYVVSDKYDDNSYQYWGDKEILWNKGYSKITFEQFKELVLNKEQMEKKIIGYKVPYDMFDGKVKKGDIFKKTTPSGLQWYDKNCSYLLPKEIVETWEKCYEEDKFKVGDYIYVIEAEEDAYGANGEIGVVTDKQSTNGLYLNENPFKVKINDEVWNIGKNAKVRKATQEEIKVAQIQLPIINGTKGEYNNNIIKYGCAEFSVRWWKGLWRGMNPVIDKDITNRKIVSVTLDSEVKITRKDVEDVINIIEIKESNFNFF